MRDHIARRPPTGSLCASVTLLPPLTRFILRAEPEAQVLAAWALGLSLVRTPGRATVVGARAALWLGPDELLLLAPEEERDELAAALEHVLGDATHSLVDISHRQCALEVRGKRASALLNGGCPRDLDLCAFPAGTCARTVLGKAEVVLWRRTEQIFQLDVWRSFTAYVIGLLAETARGL